METDALPTELYPYVTVIYNCVSFHTQQSEINQVFFCIFVSDGDFAGGEGEQGRLASAMGILPAAKESRGVWRQRWGFYRRRRRTGAFGVSDGDFAGGKGEQGRLASVCFYLVLRRVWRYTNIGGLRNDKMLMG
ncbi:MAG: hypothetical protein V8R89_07285 [Alphaproteobacteria bacterium]